MQKEIRENVKDQLIQLEKDISSLRDNISNKEDLILLESIIYSMKHMKKDVEKLSYEKYEDIYEQSFKERVEKASELLFYKNGFLSGEFADARGYYHYYNLGPEDDCKEVKWLKCIKETCESAIKSIEKEETEPKKL